MGFSRRPLVASAATLALTATLIGTATGTATAETERDPAAGPVTSAGPGTGHVASSTSQSQNPNARVTARKGSWPAKKVTAVTTQDWLSTDPVPALAQQIASTTLTQDVVRGTFSATVTLREAPTASTDSWVRIAFGKHDGDGVCQAIGGDSGSIVWWLAYGESVPLLTRDGATMRLTGFPSPAAQRDQFDCAFAETWEVLPAGAPADQEAAYFSGHGDYALAKSGVDKPKLKIKAPKKTAAKVNRWQKVKVKVRNTNPRVAAPGVKVKVKGKKVTTKTKKIGKLKPGQSKSVKVKFRVRPGHRGKAKIVVSTNNVKKQKALRLR